MKMQNLARPVEANLTFDVCERHWIIPKIHTDSLNLKIGIINVMLLFSWKINWDLSHSLYFNNHWKLRKKNNNCVLVNVISTSHFRKRKFFGHIDFAFFIYLSVTTSDGNFMDKKHVSKFVFGLSSLDLGFQ